MAVTRYNANDCTAVFNNVYITGLADSFISASKDEEFFETSVGAQGDVVVSEINNDLGTITLTVQATSPQKAMLITAAKQRTVAPIWITDTGLHERFGGTQSQIKNYPEIEKAAEAADLEIEFQVFDYTVENT